MLYTNSTNLTHITHIKSSLFKTEKSIEHQYCQQNLPLIKKRNIIYIEANCFKTVQNQIENINIGVHFTLACRHIR